MKCIKKFNSYLKKQNKISFFKEVDFDLFCCLEGKFRSSEALHLGEDTVKKV